jgi:hypothetical protein
MSTCTQKAAPREQPHPHVPSRIVNAVRRMYNRHEPLNLTAVSRNHPLLIRDLHNRKRFLTWRDAIAAAGLSYANARKELIDCCTCLYCGAEKASLAVHLRTAHDVAPSLYREEYPDQDLISERLRADKSLMQSKHLPHWEPLWSPEYVLERACEFLRRDIPVDSAWIARNEKPFYAAGIRYFHRWNAILEAIGADPAEATLKARLRSRRYPDKDAVVREIRRRRQLDLPINSSCVRPALYGHGHKNVHDTALSMSAVQCFGSWDKALREAGFDPAAVHRDARPEPRYASKVAVCRELKRRHERGRPLKVAHILASPPADSALVVTARALFGTWHKALHAAGVPIPVPDRKGRVGPPRRYPTKTATIVGIRRRRRQGYPLNVSSLFEGPCLDTALHRSGTEFFGNWANAVVAAGIDHREAHARPGPKPRRRRDLVR